MTQPQENINIDDIDNDNIESSFINPRTQLLTSSTTTHNKNSSKTKVNKTKTIFHTKLNVLNSTADLLTNQSMSTDQSVDNDQENTENQNHMINTHKIRKLSKSKNLLSKMSSSSDNDDEDEDDIFGTDTLKVNDKKDLNNLVNIKVNRNMQIDSDEE